MNYPQILSKVFQSFLLLTEDKHDAIIAALENRLNGHRVMEDDYAESTPKEDPDYFEVGSTAIIRVEGILGKHLSSMEMLCGGCSLDKVSTMLEVATKSQRIETIGFHFISPGGTYTGTPELARQIRDCGKPTFAFVDSECCSGALWLASQCDHFWATESAVVGSVGVRMVLLDYSRALEMEGVKVNAITSGKYKMAGANFKPLEPDEREMFQAESDRIHAEFKSAVALKRIPNEDALQGQTFYGQAAFENGLTDGLVDDLETCLALTSTVPVNGIQIL